MNTLVEITDAVAADLNGLALPAHKTWKYVEPGALRMDQGLWLAVFPAVVDYGLIATESSYFNADMFTVWWAEPAFEVAEYNTRNEALAKAALDRAELIAERLESYAEGVPGTNQLWAVPVRAELGIPTTDMSWRAAWTLKVEEFSL